MPTEERENWKSLTSLWNCLCYMEHIRTEALKSYNAYTHRKAHTALCVPLCYLWVRLNQKERSFPTICGKCPSKVNPGHALGLEGLSVRLIVLFFPFCCLGPHTEGDHDNFVCQALDLDSTSLSSDPVGFL